MSVYVGICVFVHISAGAQEDQKGASDTQELEYRCCIATM